MRLSDYVKGSSDYVFGWLGYTGQADYERTCLLRESDNKDRAHHSFSRPWRGNRLLVYGPQPNPNARQSKPSAANMGQGCATPRFVLPLKKHLEHYLALSSLLSIITWRNIGFKSLSVLAEDDVTLTLGNDTVGPFPRPVMTNLHDPWTEPRAHKPYLFRYTDIGQAGLAKWFELRRTYENPLNEFSYIARMHEALTLQSQILIYGTAFEELGGVIAKENSEKTSRSIEKRIQRILSDCELELFSNDKTISSAIANTYNAIKHTDFQREELTRQDALAMDNLFSITTACRALALLWIGSKLGCGEKFVENLTEESTVATPIRQWL